MFLDLAKHTQIGYIDKALVCYRVLRESFSHSANLEKTFDFVKSLFHIRLDYIEKYGSSERARRLVIEGINEALFLFGFRMYRRDQCLQAYEWLMVHNPERYGAFPFRVLALAIRNKALWRIVRRIESTAIARSKALELFSLRNQGQTEMLKEQPTEESARRPR